MLPSCGGDRSIQVGAGIVVQMDPHTLLRGMYDAAVAAVDPAAAVRGALVLDDDVVRCGDMAIPATGRLIVLAFGKAASAMARGLCDVLGDRAMEGVIVTSHAPDDAPFPVIIGGHPSPTQGSIEGAEALLRLARSAQSGDVVFALVSGGGSAIATMPADGLTLADLEVASRTLMNAGADIAELNTVRKHLSGFKGGRLGAACGSATLVTLIVSDVVGDAVDVIASGPTVADRSSFGDALDVVKRRGVRHAVPATVIAHLERGARGEIEETPETGHDDHHVQIVAGAAAAASAALEFAERHGTQGRILTTTLEGEARGEAVRMVASAEPGKVLVVAGETTVNVTGSGRGGRNQEAALAAALHLDDVTTFLAAGTDGIDGPTDAAGAIVDGTTADRIRSAGIDPETALENNDAYTALTASGDLIITGPSGTNVGDVWFVHARDADA